MEKILGFNAVLIPALTRKNQTGEIHIQCVYAWMILSVTLCPINNLHYKDLAIYPIIIKSKVLCCVT